jgi:hypothetical protein
MSLTTPSGFTEPVLETTVYLPKVVPTQQVAAACVRILNQCAELTRGLDDRSFTTPSNLLKGGTIGKHLRHTLDHLAAAVRCGDDPIDYDHRRRGGSVETDRQAALLAMDKLSEELTLLGDADYDRSVRVRCMLSGAGEQAQVRSTVGRELAFAMHHAIHHQAMIRAIALELGSEAPEQFGVAPDTLHHMSTQVAQK